MKRSMKNPYRCETCKEFFSYYDRKIIERDMYGIKVVENACPYCGSWNITSYNFGHKAENKYLNHDIVKDGRYYAK